MFPVDDLPTLDKDALCFMNNPKLKRANLKIPYTQEQLDEYVRCKRDILYFVKNYVKIVNLDVGLTLFKLYPYQEEMITTFKDNRFSICLTARQMGKTTTVAAYLLYEAIFNKNLRIAVLANKGDTAREILGRMQSMFEDLPWYLKPGVTEWNKGRVKFGNGTVVLSAATSSSSIRGQSMNIIYLDELAFIQNDMEFFTSTYPVISSGKKTKVIITSTPNGMNLFYKLWTDAENKRNSFVPKKFLWYHHPDRDEAWKNETLKNISEKQFNQEFDCLFLGSSDTLISGSKLQKLVFKEPISKSESYTVYAAPEKDRNYAVTVDVGEGIGKDYSIISVFDITEAPYRHVALYRDNLVHPITLASHIKRIGDEYNEAYVVVENNTVGKITAETLYYDFEYENMLTGAIRDSDAEVGTSRNWVGIRTTKKTKMIGCSNLKSMIESDTLITEDFDAIAELASFIKKGTSFQAEDNKTDDIVMSMVLFAWFANQSYFQDVTNVDVRATIRANLARLDEESHLVFGFYDNGVDESNDLFT